MIIIIHENAEKIDRVILDNNDIPVVNSQLTKEFWRLANEYPQEFIIWLDKRFEDEVNISQTEKIFHHDLIMASFSIREQFFPSTIGYIDQLPFVKPNYDVVYPTWRMSTNVGGIKAQTALLFKSTVNKNDSFGYIINSIAKIGQQNSLFCYSDPSFLKKRKQISRLHCKSETKELFQFVYQFYKTQWLFILLFCFIKYERRFPFLSFVSGFFKKKNFKANVDLDAKKLKSKIRVSNKNEISIDVIIPTLKRTTFLEQVLTDLQAQTLRPKKVIIVEQDPDKDSTSQLLEIIQKNWSFEIVHVFTRSTGACKARNLAMKHISSEWIFFADDDIRIPSKTLEEALDEITRLGIMALNLNCVQVGDYTVFQKIKQWGAFGSGTSIVSSEYALQCTFREEYEFGFGEDTDFGLQLRNIGVDIIYHPYVKIAHLKAARGGFREVIIIPWANEDISPKPSPTMMHLVRTHFDIYMLRGYKISLFIKFYSRQSIKNPFSYLSTMNQKWVLSEIWAEKISQNQSLSKTG